MQPCHIQNPGTFRTQRELQKFVEHVRSSGRFRALGKSEQFIQAFSKVFRNIQGF